MQKILENFIKSVKKDSNIKKVVSLDWPKGEESLVLIGINFSEKFENRPKRFLKYLPHTTGINIVCYSVNEWKWIEENKLEFLEIIKSYGEIIFDRHALTKLLSSIKRSDNLRERGGKSKDFKLWIDKKIHREIEIEMIGKSFFSLAKKDLQAGKILLENNLLEQSIFMSSQSIEKFIKGYLAKKKKIFDKTHNLPDLYKRCFEDRNPSLEKRLNNIQKLYLVLRYPAKSFSGKTGKPIRVSKRKAEEVVEIAETILKLVA